MRLDHLLSREKSRSRNAEVQFQVDTLQKQREIENPVEETGRITVRSSESVSFPGITLEVP